MTRFFAILLAISVAVIACSKEEYQPPAFEPDPMFTDKHDEIGVNYQRPGNVHSKRDGQVITLSADGFPTVTITVKDTDDASKVGKKSSISNKDGEWVIYAPKREITCACADMGKYQDTVTAICESVENTKLAAKSPKVEASLEVTGEITDKAAYQTALDGVKAAVDTCWTNAVNADAELGDGNLTFTFTFKADGTKASWASAGSFTGNRAYKPFEDCAKPLVEAIPAAAVGADATVVVTYKATLY